MAAAARGLFYVIVLVLLWPTGYAQNSSETGISCRTPNNEVGQCVPLTFCEPYREILISDIHSEGNGSYVRQARCKIKGLSRLVCCPASGVVQHQDGERWSRGTRGHKRKRRPWKAGYNRRTRPGGRRKPGRRRTTVPLSKHRNWKYLRTDVCGAGACDRKGDGAEANPKEFPWLALLRYRTRTGLHFLCGGSLIGQRYVLTAAHCVTNSRNERLVSVRLGEYNTDTDPDCKTHDNDTICGDPVQDFNISKIIVHPRYVPKSGRIHNDIALIRLDRIVPVTDYIAPICVPKGNVTWKRFTGENLTVAGWGLAGNSTPSNVKLWTGVPVVSRGKCAQAYRHILRINSDMICGCQTRDSCRGDSGGPLMAFDSALPGRSDCRSVIAGVMSTFPTTIGSSATEVQPGVYTRVGSYVRWILDNLRS